MKLCNQSNLTSIARTITDFIEGGRLWGTVKSPQRLRFFSCRSSRMSIAAWTTRSIHYSLAPFAFSSTWIRRCETLQNKSDAQFIIKQFYNYHAQKIEDRNGMWFSISDNFLSRLLSERKQGRWTNVSWDTGKFDELKVSRNNPEFQRQKADKRQSVDLHIPAYEITSNSLINHPSAV